VSIVDSVRVIDTDTHVIEPYDLWTSRVSTKRWGDQVPHVRWDEKTQQEAWFQGDNFLHSAASPAMTGWGEYPPLWPKRLSDVDERLWRADLRLQVMDEYGVYANVLYQNLAGFGVGYTKAVGEPELRLACIQAYNDFIHEYSSVAPERLLPIAGVPFWDVQASLKEMERCKGMNHRGIILSGTPDYWGQPLCHRL
jgi:predicted TIM-barrel fold metal-dependent hydrolase